MGNNLTEKDQVIIGLMFGLIIIMVGWASNIYYVRPVIKVINGQVYARINGTTISSGWYTLGDRVKIESKYEVKDVPPGEL
jgi:hypothetical protein